jgi:hypothetical protein
MSNTLTYYRRAPTSIFSGLAALGGIIAIVKIFFIALNFVNKFYFEKELSVNSQDPQVDLSIEKMQDMQSQMKEMQLVIKELQ